MIQLPKAPNQYSLPIWNQTNDSDINGSLWASFNLDLSENEGKIRLGKRLVLNTNTTDSADLTSYPAAFKVFGSSKFSVAGLSGTGYVFSNATTYPSAVVFAKVTGSNTPTNIDSTLSDIEVSNGNMYVSSASNTIYWTSDGSTWQTAFTVGASDTTNSHMMTSFNGRTYMSKLQSLVLSWDSSNVVATSGTYTLQLGNSASNQITCLRSSSNRIWVCTVNTTGGKGYVYEWDGTTVNSPTKSYRLESSGALACVIKDDIPYIIDTNGALLYWNGGTFVKLAQLNRRNKKLLYNPLSSVNDRFIHPNGMSIINGKINILIDGRNYSNTSPSSYIVEETIPSGIYEYDENRGLTHKQSFGLSHAADTITDYGQIRISGAGALSELNIPNSLSTRNGTFLAGCTYYSDATTTNSGIFYDDSNDTLQKAGSLISTKLYAQDPNTGVPSVQNMWQNIYTIYRKFLDSGDKIVVKFRFAEVEPIEGTITWTSTTSFTTSLDISAYAKGDEVEILNGIGGGKCAHITDLQVGALSTYIVTLDETFTSASGTAIARFQHWKKLTSITSNPALYDQSLVGELSNWIQFKVWMLFTGKDELEKLLIINQDFNPAN